MTFFGCCFENKFETIRRCPFVVLRHLYTLSVAITWCSGIVSLEEDRQKLSLSNFAVGSSYDFSGGLLRYLPVMIYDRSIVFGSGETLKRGES